jgi:hypothetical protein
MGLRNTLNGVQPQKKKLTGISAIDPADPFAADPNQYVPEAPSQEAAAPAPGQVPEAPVPQPAEPASKPEQPDDFQAKFEQIYKAMGGGSKADEAVYDAKTADEIMKAYNAGRIPPEKNKDLMTRQNELLATPEVSAQVDKYQKAIANLDAQIQQKMQEKRETADRSDMAAIGEQLGNAILMLGAGMYGMKHGVNMQGTQFNRTDWERRLANRLGMINEEIQLGREGQKIAQGQLHGLQGDIREQAKEEFRAGEKREQEFNQDTRGIQQSAITAGIQSAREQARDENAIRREALSYMLKELGDKKSEQKAEQHEIQMLQRTNLAEANKIAGEKRREAQMEVDGFKQAIQIMNDEDMKDSVKAALLAKALGRTTTDPAELEAEKKSFFNFFGPSDKELQLKFLQGRMKQAQGRLDGLRQLAPEPQAAAPAAAPANPAAPAGEVKMISPDGQIGTIPAANVEAAKAQGFKLAE